MTACLVASSINCMLVWCPIRMYHCGPETSLSCHSFCVLLVRWMDDDQKFRIHVCDITCTLTPKKHIEIWVPRTWGFPVHVACSLVHCAWISCSLAKLPLVLYLQDDKSKRTWYEWFLYWSVCVCMYMLGTSRGPACVSLKFSGWF